MAVGLIVVAIGMSFGALHDYAINPAHDLGAAYDLGLRRYPPAA